MPEVPSTEEIVAMSDELHNVIDTNGDLTEYQQGLLDAIMWVRGAGDKPTVQD